MKIILCSLLIILYAFGVAPIAYGASTTTVKITELKGDFYGTQNESWGIEPFSDGLAKVYKNTKTGFINKTGNMITALDYEYADEFSDGMALVRQNGREFFINSDGKEVLSLPYDGALPFSEGYARVVIEQNETSKYGFIDTTGKLVIPAIYDCADNFSEGLAWVAKDGKQAYINKEGKIVFFLPNGERGFFSRFYNPDEGQFKNGFAIIARFEDGVKQVGIRDKTGREVVSSIYDRVGYFYDGLAYVMKDGKFGFVNECGEVVIPLIYQTVGDFSDGLACVSLDCKHYFYINKEGNKVLEVPDSNGFGEFSKGMVSIRLESTGMMGVINKEGALVIPAKYDRIGSFSYDLAVVKNGERFGYIDRQGVEVVPAIYDRADDIVDGLALLRLDEKYYVLEVFDGTGDETEIPPVSVKINGRDIPFDVPPVIIGERVLVPVRFVAENMGAKVTWDQAKKEVTIKRGDITIFLVIDSPQITVNGKIAPIETKAILLDNRTIMPISAVVEALGGSICWDNQTRSVSIKMVNSP